MEIYGMIEEESQLLITKVKDNSDIFIGYTRKTRQHADVRTSKCNEPPRPELRQAFFNLKKHAAHILGFQDPKQGLRLSVHTVNFTYEIDGRMGAQMCCTYQCPNGEETNINTPPMKCPATESEMKSAAYFTEEAVKALWALEAEARKYLEGKRAQTTLFDDENQASKVEETVADADDADEDADGDFDSDAYDKADGFAATAF